MTTPLAIVKINDVAEVCARCRALGQPGQDTSPFYVPIGYHRVMLSDIYESATSCKNCTMLITAMESAVDVAVGSVVWVDIMFKVPPLLQGPLRIDIVVGPVTTRLQLYVPTGKTPRHCSHFYICARLIKSRQPSVALDSNWLC
jgi:hypothetical protein